MATTTCTWLRFTLTTYPMMGCIWAEHLVIHGRCLPDDRSCHQDQGMGTGHFSSLIFKPAQPCLQVNKVNLGKTTRYNQTYDQSHNGHSHQVWFSKNFRDNNRQQRGPLNKGQGQLQYKNGPKKKTCYYREYKHKIKDCIKLAKERAKDKERDTDIAKQYKNKHRDTVQ